MIAPTDFGERRAYDGLGRRIEKTAGADPDPLDQYVWDIRYVDAAVVRFHDGNTNGSYEDAGDNILYYTQDANFNVTAVVDAATGGAAERYVYTPYGQATFLSGQWQQSVSSVANETLYCGYLFDGETGMYHVRHRDYQPTLACWLQRDAEGYGDGMSLYQYCRSSPVMGTDPSGTIVIGLWGWEDLDKPGRQISGKDTITEMVDRIGGMVGDDDRIKASGTYFTRPRVEEELCKWRTRVETEDSSEQFVLFGFSDGATTVWRVISQNNERNYNAAVKGARTEPYHPAYFGMIDMVRRFFIPVQGLSWIGESPNDVPGRPTDSSLNTALNGKTTVVENYRNEGFRKGQEPLDDVYRMMVGPSMLGNWRGFQPNGVGIDYVFADTYHATILKAVEDQVVAHAISAYGVTP